LSDQEGAMKLTAARKKFKNTWMAFKIERKKPEIEGTVLGTAKSVDAINNFVEKNHLNGVYITFNGQVFPKGVGFFF